MNIRSILLAAVASLITGVLVSQAQVPGVNSTLTAVFNLVYDNSTMKPTYSATRVMVPSSGFDDVCVLSGSATRNVRVRRVIFSGIASAVVTEPVAIVKRSTMPTNGTGTSPTPVPYDSVNSLTGSASNAGTAVVEAFTVSPTPGAMVGVLIDILVGFGNLTTGLGMPPTVFTFGALGSPVVLRGVAQSIAVNLSGVSYTTLTVSCTFEWTEE